MLKPRTTGNCELINTDVPKINMMDIKTIYENNGYILIY